MLKIQDTSWKLYSSFFYPQLRVSISMNKAEFNNRARTIAACTKTKVGNEQRSWAAIPIYMVKHFACGERYTLECVWSGKALGTLMFDACKFNFHIELYTYLHSKILIKLSPMQAIKGSHYRKVVIMQLCITMYGNRPHKVIITLLEEGGQFERV